MTITPSSSVNNAATASAGAAKGTSKDQFLKLFLAQLQNQNPLEPMQDRDFLMQLAQFTQVENAEEMTRTLQQLQTLVTATQATTLLGKQVVALPEGEASSVEGKVSAVRFTADGIRLIVGGKEVRVQNILQVSG
ncbi:MAG: flagellar hook capping FlgD N-terminal domain-containing protein [Armatimonadota bacterium]|nr:flagellar hook capping protein [bacterium]MDW8320250.1 flagellar hook capping FlgD N-terminal domain-containing protein [Armatimonadota bacterium]